MIEALVVIGMLFLTLTPSAFLLYSCIKLSSKLTIYEAKHSASQNVFEQELSNKMRHLEDSLIKLTDEIQSMADWDKKLRDMDSSNDAFNLVKTVNL